MCLQRELYEGFLKAVPIFATLTPDEILTIADTLQPVVFKAGEAVVSQGDAHADRFYIVEDGELKAEIRGVPGEVCERLRCGSYFGERALIKVSPRAIRTRLFCHVMAARTPIVALILIIWAPPSFSPGQDEPRAATVTAVALSKCLAMDRAAFLRLLGPITELLHRNLEVYSRYASGTTPRVSSPPPGRTFGTTA
jgi:cAMP-dependent protein kinase regulator